MKQPPVERALPPPPLIMMMKLLLQRFLGHRGCLQQSGGRGPSEPATVTAEQLDLQAPQPAAEHAAPGGQRECLSRALDAPLTLQSCGSRLEANELGRQEGGAPRAKKELETRVAEGKM